MLEGRLWSLSWGRRCTLRCRGAQLPGHCFQTIVDDGTDTLHIKTTEKNDNEKLSKDTTRANLEATSVETKTGMEPSLNAANFLSLCSWVLKKKNKVKMNKTSPTTYQNAWGKL